MLALTEEEGTCKKDSALTTGITVARRKAGIIVHGLAGKLSHDRDGPEAMDEKRGRGSVHCQDGGKTNANTRR